MLTLVLGASLALTLFMAAPAAAKFGLTDFTFTFDKDAKGTPALQAGSHPYQVNTTFNVNTKPGPGGKAVPDGDVKALRFDLPPGFIGSLDAVPPCSSADFSTVDEFSYPACPNATAVGTAQVQVINPGGTFVVPVFNLTPPPGVAAKIGFIAFPKIPVTIEVGLNGAAPNNVVPSVINIPQVVEFYGSSLQIWGVPADPAHDPFRGDCITVTSVAKYGDLTSNGTCPTSAAKVPFLTMPRSCEGPLVSSYEAISWQEPDAAPDKGSYAAPSMIGCSSLSFTPGITARPTVSTAESASGIDVDIDVKDEGLTSPTGQATQSDIKKAVVTLPPGMTVNPSSANGLAVCSRSGYEAETLFSAPGQGCPQASKVGEVEVESPLLPKGEILRGSVFLASQDDNPFGTLIALYMVIRDSELGVLIKRPLKVEPNEVPGPEAGRIVTTLDDFPQVPFSHSNFHFKEGARAPLITPPACGAYATGAQFTPWADPSANPFATAAGFGITAGVAGGPCPPGGVPPFNPGFSAGSLNNNGGAYSPFDMRLTRSDGEQEMTRFDAVLPKGVTGKLAGVARCPDSAIAEAKAKSGRQELANPSCPAGSQIGHTLAGAGVGSVLTYVPGKLYLAGPFAGAPLSVIAITTALAGPFDVGTVVLHEALTVDPDTAEVRVDGARSDPIPNLLRGIRVKARDLRVYTDRPSFTLNPTSCARKEARATLFGSFLDVFSPADDAPAQLSDRYQAASCASLKFKPNLSLRLKGGTKRGAHPAVNAVATYPPGTNYANTKKVVVTFPHSMFLEQAHIRTVCTRVQFRANQCPPGSVYGKVRAFTPLLDQPLAGNVYLRSSSNPLPDAVFALRGEIDFNAVARVDSVNASLRVSFETVPDAPLSKVIVEMQGGKKGLFVNSRNLCAHKSRAKAAFTAHNGKAYTQKPVVKAGCGKGK